MMNADGRKKKPLQVVPKKLKKNSSHNNLNRTKSPVQAKEPEYNFYELFKVG